MHAVALKGAKGPATPVDETDTLRSTQRAEFVDLIGEGMVGGLVRGLKSIYLDGVPVENEDGSRNFGEFAYGISLGGPTDLAAPQTFGETQTEVGVGVTVTTATAVVRSVSDTSIDAIRVTLTVPTLVEQKSNGDRVGASIEFAIDVQSAGGGFVERHHDTIIGKATSTYNRSIRVDLKATGPGPWDVRVRRITADSSSANLVNAFSWSSYTLISGIRMLYRNSSVAALTFNAANFSSIPSRWYDVMGVSDWDIPVNYDPLARTVSGIWNGTFTQAWTNNPAWVLYNLIQHPRYGLGDYIAQLPDKWVLYQLQQWCDEPLSDGRGGTEPRYTINAEINTQSEALRLLQDICNVFRGALLHSGATLGVSWDAPGAPVAIYTPANVVDGTFTYSDSSSAAKKTSCTCWYTDRTQYGKREPMTWDDADLVTKYGQRNMEINPIGVATPGQALRMAKWALYTNDLEGGTVAFQVGAQGATGRVGEVFQVNDPSEAGERLGGRVVAATTTQVTLDGEVVLAAGQTYTLWVTLPHPSDITRLVTEERTVTNSAGTHSMLTLASAYTQAPLPQTMWLLEGSDVKPTLWRYVAIAEVASEGGEAGVQYQITGLKHEPGKFDLVELDQPLTPRPTRRLPDGAPPVASVSITETVYLDGTVQRIRVSVSWPIPAPGLRYLVSWRLDNGLWNDLPLTPANGVDIDGMQPGFFEVRVFTQNALGMTSIVTLATATLTGPTSLPPNVTGLAAAAVQVGIEVSWTRWESGAAGDTELRVRTDAGFDWDTATPLWRGRADTYTAVAPPAGSYVVLAKHWDAPGALTSAAAASITLTWDGVNLLGVLSISATNQIFKVDAAGTAATPSFIDFEAHGAGLAGSPSFAVTAGTATLTGSGTTRQLAFANMASDTATIEVTWAGQTDAVTVYKLRDGSDAYSWGLENEHQNIACTPGGTPFAGLPIASKMVVAKGSTLLTSGVAFAVGTVAGFSGVSIHPTTGVIAITGITADSASALFTATVGSTVLQSKLTATKTRDGDEGNDGDDAVGVRISTTSQIFQKAKDGTVTPATITLTANQQNLSALGAVTYAWTTTPNIGSGSAATFNVTDAAMGANQTLLVQVTASAPGATVTDRMTLVRVAEGADALTVIMDNESHSLPADLAGVVLSYAGAGGRIKVLRGALDVTSACTFSYLSSVGFSSTPTASMVASGVNAGTYALTGAGTGGVISAAVDLATVTYRMSYLYAGVTYTIDKVFTVTKSKVGVKGDRGSVRFSWQNNTDFQRYPNRVSPKAKWAVLGTLTGTNDSDGTTMDTAATSWFNNELTTRGLPTGLQIGDELVVSGGAQPASATGWWSGTQWIDPGFVFEGNVLVKGTVTGLALNAVYTLSIEDEAVVVPRAATTATDTTITATSSGSAQTCIEVLFLVPAITAGEDAVPSNRSITVAVATLAGVNTNAERMFIQIARKLGAGGAWTVLYEVPVHYFGNLDMVFTVPITDTATLTQNTSYYYGARVYKSASPGVPLVVSGASIIVMGSKGK